MGPERGTVTSSPPGSSAAGHGRCPSARTLRLCSVLAAFVDPQPQRLAGATLMTLARRNKSSTAARRRRRRGRRRGDRGPAAPPPCAAHSPTAIVATTVRLASRTTETSLEPPRWSRRPRCLSELEPTQCARLAHRHGAGHRARRRVDEPQSPGPLIDRERLFPVGGRRRLVRGGAHRDLGHDLPAALSSTSTAASSGHLK